MGPFEVVPVADAPKPLWRRREEPSDERLVEAVDIGGVVFAPVQILLSQGTLKPLDVGVGLGMARVVEVVGDVSFIQ